MPLYTAGNPLGPSKPTPIHTLHVKPTPFTPVNVYSGYRHHFLSGATNEGTNIYSFGTGEAFRLGLDDDAEREEPEMVVSLTNKTISEIACGREHSVFLLTTGRVFGCGWGEAGRVGVGKVSAS